MNIERALEILSKDIEEIEEILSGIEKTSLPDDLEMALALSKLRNLRENFTTLGRTMKKNVEQVSVPSPPPHSSAREEPSREVPEINATEEVPPPAPEPPSASGESPAPSAAATEEKKVAGKTKKEKTVFLSDTFEHKQAFRNESLGKAHPKDVSSSIKNRPLSDLRRAIGLNEKFMFIRDLFGGDSKVYEETVHFINKATSPEEVNKVLARFKWDEKKEAVREFRELVERKLKSLNNG